MSETSRGAVTMRRRRPQKGEERRADLLTALEALLTERRLSDVGVDDIARAAGVRRTAFYFYFANKATAVAALLGEAFDDLLAGASEFMGGGGPPTPALRQALSELWAFWRQREGLMLAMLDARDSDPEVRALWDEWLERFVPPVAAVISTERREGRARPGPDPVVLVRLLLTMNLGALERATRNGVNEEHDAEVIDGSVHVWTCALYG